MTDRAEGGCQCSRIRYAADVRDADAYLCHCRMCRKATGGASIAFVSVALAGVSFASEPDWYESSPIARRPFCAACGTPLGFVFSQGAERMDLTLGSFDDPARFRPSHNYATESLLAEWIDASHLPGARSDENANVVDRWMAATGRVPD